MITNKSLMVGAVLAAMSIWIIFIFWDQSFSVLTIDVKMNRSTAIASTAEQVDAFPLIREHSEYAAIYQFDSVLRDYIELKQGGKEQFQEIINGDIYAPYFWSVRVFEENEISEGTFFYKPNGDTNGFSLKIADDYEDASVTEVEALAMVQKNINRYWMGDLSDYKLIESSFEEQSNGRIDHAFVFEHSQSDFGEARFRLSVLVSGSQLSRVSPYSFIPEEFSREFSSMRSSNGVIAIVSNLLMIALYFLAIGIPSLVYLHRKRWLQYKCALLVAGFIAIASALLSLNSLPLQFFNYDTATSLSQFMLQQLLGVLAVGLLNFVIFGIGFILAESLTRLVFPEHIQLWKTWNRDVASSKYVLNNTLLSYLLVPCFLAFVLLFYYFTQKFLGFWVPSEAMVDPNYLGAIFPWYTGLAISLQAGFGEEMIFRAIPLSAGLLIGRHYQRPILGVMIAMIVQSLIFGAAHANYPSMPYYARILELIVPSVMFGFVYIRMGVLFGAITHYVYDVVLISLPLLFSSGFMFDKTIVIVGAFIPLGVVLVQRYRAKCWSKLGEESFNKSYQPAVASKPKVVESVSIETKTQTFNSKALGYGFLVCLVLLFWFQDNRIDIQMDSVQLDRESAIDRAKQYLEEAGVPLLEDEGYEAYASFKSGNQADTFVWQELGEETYKSLLDSYLLSPGWDVRFVNYEGDLESRAEEIKLRLNLKGQVTYFDHKRPESREGATLTQAAAKMLADSEVSKRFGLDPTQLKIVSEKNELKPQRMDWVFIYEEANDFNYEGVQLRSEIRIVGDEIGKYFQYVFIPEEWQRMDRERFGIPKIINGVVQVSALILLFGLFIYNGFCLLSKGTFSVPTFSVFAALGLLAVINLLNDSSLLSNLPTDQPIGNLKLITYATTGFGLVVSSLFLGFIFATLRSLLQPINNTISIGGSILGGLFAASVFYLLTIPLEMLFYDLYATYPRISLSGFYMPFINTLNPFPALLFAIAYDLLRAKLLFDFTKGYKKTVKHTVIGFLITLFLIGFNHFPMSFLVGISLLKLSVISLGTFLIFKYIIRNNFMMVPFFSIACYFINYGLAKGGFFGFESYPNESLILLLATFVAVLLLAVLMPFVFGAKKESM